MKSFESLWAELAQKAIDRPAGSGTVAALDGGIHSIGKKILEEAGEVWLAAEHEGDEALAQEISQLLYHLQTLMLARGFHSMMFTAICNEERPSVLRIAVPNKGSLAESAAEVLREAGYRQRTDLRDLVLLDPENGVEFYYLRPRDIAVYVGSGDLEAGITGRDLLIDSGAVAQEVLELDFGGSTFRFAAGKEHDWSLPDIAGKRVATAYPGLVADYLAKAGIVATVVRLDGAVESSVRLRVADVIADVVSTGNTLRQAGLKTFGEPILTSEAVLIQRGGVASPAGLEIWIRRLPGVVTDSR